MRIDPKLIRLVIVVDFGGNVYDHRLGFTDAFKSVKNQGRNMKELAVVVYLRLAIFQLVL